jgi:DNA helicase HerA-like ATPase
MGYNAYSLSQGKREPVVWDTQTLLSGHGLWVGRSGSGKSYALREMIKQISAQAKVRVHVMDVHGDLDIDGSSSVKFSEATLYGFNPLTINPDPDFGGVRKRIQSFIGALSRTGFRLGPKQEAALRNILYDLYGANGFYDDQPKSWRLDDGVQRQFPKKMPSMEDALKFARAKLRMMFLGTSSESVTALEKLNKKQGQFYTKNKKLRNAAGSSAELDILKKELEVLAEEAAELYRKHMGSMITGHELEDLIKYDSKDVMKSVVDRLENLHSIGIFRPQRPPFDPKNPIWRYDIKALAQDEKKLFVSFILEAIFQRASQRGVQEDVVEIIVLDEAHLFLTDDADNPINIIAKEGRKFGLAIFCASQSPTHFSDDFLSNVSTKVILGIDQMYWDGSVRKLKVDMKALEWIVPQQKILVQLNNRGQAKNSFIYTTLKG